MQMNLDLSQSFQILERKMRLVGIFVRFEKSNVILLCFYCGREVSFRSNYRGRFLETKYSSIEKSGFY